MKMLRGLQLGKKALLQGGSSPELRPQARFGAQPPPTSFAFHPTGMELIQQNGTLSSP